MLLSNDEKQIVMIELGFIVFETIHEDHYTLYALEIIIFETLFSPMEVTPKYAF